MNLRTLEKVEGIRVEKRQRKRCRAGVGRERISQRKKPKKILRRASKGETRIKKGPEGRYLRSVEGDLSDPIHKWEIYESDGEARWGASVSHGVWWGEMGQY